MLSKAASLCSCKPINLRSTVTCKAVASLGHLYFWLSVMMTFHHSYITVSPWSLFNPPDPATGTSVPSTNNHRHTRFLSCARICLPLLLSRGGECACECLGHGGRGSQRLGFSRQFIDSLNACVGYLLPCF